MAQIATRTTLVAAAALFIIGTIADPQERGHPMSIELILNAVNLNLVAFSRLWGLHG